MIRDSTNEPLAVLLTPRELAAMLKVSVRTLEAWRRNRVGPLFLDLTPGRPRYLLSDVHEWIAKNRVRTYPARSP